MSLAEQLARASAFDRKRFVPFFVDGETVGWLLPAFAHTLQEFGGMFANCDDGITPRAVSFARRSDDLEEVAKRLAARGIVVGWRGERYTAFSPARGVPLFELERAAWRRFGLPARAAHLNGYVRTADGVQVWVARRSMTKPIDPGLLDNLVGGGIATNMTAWTTLIKECREEAGIPGEVAAQARPFGSLQVRRMVDEGLHDERLFVFDLALSESFRPTNLDGEVSEFMLIGLPELEERLAAAEFAPDAAAVAIDFLSRQGEPLGDQPAAAWLGKLRVR